MLSIVYRTYRPHGGGIGEFAASLRNQTFTDFEAVVVDDYPDRDVDAVKKAFDGLNLRWYGKSKPKCYPQYRFNQLVSINTGLLHCSPNTEYIISVDDFCMLRPNCMELWNSYLRWGKEGFLPDARTAYSGVAAVYDGAPATTLNGVRTELPTLNDEPKYMWIPEFFELFYFGMPKNLWVELNGMDERMEEWREFPVLTFPEQCRQANITLKVDKNNITNMLDHRTWDGQVWHINNMGGKSPGIVPPIMPRSPNCFNLGTVLC